MLPRIVRPLSWEPSTIPLMTDLLHSVMARVCGMCVQIELKWLSTTLCVVPNSFIQVSHHTSCLCINKESWNFSVSNYIYVHIYLLIYSIFQCVLPILLGKSSTYLHLKVVCIEFFIKDVLKNFQKKSNLLMIFIIFL